MRKKPTSLRKLFTSPRKWTKGVYENRRGAHCLLGGLLYVYAGPDDTAWGNFTSHLPTFRKAIRSVGKVLRAEGRRGVCGDGVEDIIVEFNDLKTTTFKDIKRVIRKAKV